MRQVPTGKCLKVLGVYVQLDGHHAEEFRQTVAVAWPCYQSKAALWRARGSAQQAARFASFSLSGPGVVFRHAPFDCGRSAVHTNGPLADDEAKMRLVAAGTETYLDYAKRTARWAEALWAEAGVPS